MDRFLMWEFKNVKTGIFHTASSKAERTTMLGKGYQDITGFQSWNVKYPTGKSNTLIEDPSILAPDVGIAPIETAPIETPDQTLVDVPVVEAPAVDAKSTKKSK